MSGKWCAYFNETDPKEYRFLGFYEYRAKQADFTFSFQKESYKLQMDLDNLMKDGPEESKKTASQLKTIFMEKNEPSTTTVDNGMLSTLWSECPLYLLFGHRNNFRDVNAFWNKIELNGRLQDQLQTAAFEATNSFISISKKTFATTMGNVRSAIENVNDTLSITGAGDTKKRPTEERFPVITPPNLHDHISLNGYNEESAEVADTSTEASLKTSDQTKSDLEITKSQDNDDKEEDIDPSLDAQEQSPKRRKTANGLFHVISDDTTVEFNLPEDIKEYVKELLTGDVENAFFKVEKPLNYDACPLLLWTREVCRHFLLYYRYGGLQQEGGEKTWSTQTVYRILDLFLIFFGNTISGIAFGEILNEAHNDRAYNINYTQKPAKSGHANKNDAVLYQDKDATVLYEQSYGPTEFVLSHKLDDFVKLARNGVDDLNYHFTNNENCTVTTAKKLKSVGIHGYKYLISVYLTDMIRIKTYRIYEIFSFKIPTSYSERWELLNIVRFGVLLEKLLTERRNIKTEISMENALKTDVTRCVRDWIKIPDNTPPRIQTQTKILDNTPPTLGFVG
ncbi:13888_t:CDS:10, partial [Cetraspora pellucida]